MVEYSNFAIGYRHLFPRIAGALIDAQEVGVARQVGYDLMIISHSK